MSYVIILYREVRTAPVVRAMEGVRECGVSLDYRNTNVLACSGKLSISDFDWVIVAEIDHAEVDAFADELRTNLFVLFGIFGAVTLVSAVVLLHSAQKQEILQIARITPE